MGGGAVSPSVLVNRSYRTQRVTGQQRYAIEVERRLSATAAFGTAEPRGFWARSALRTWAWVQFVLPFAAGRAAVLSMTSRAPIWRRRAVVVVHDLFVLNHPEWYSRRYIWTHAPLLRAQLRSAAAVVAVSRPVADQLAAYRDDPVAVAPNAPSAEFDSKLHEGPDDDAVTSRGLVADSYLLAVGSKDPRKNLPRLLAAYGRLTADERARMPLVLVGGGNAIFRDESLDLPPGTVDAGYVSDQDLRQLYRHARSMVMVSYDEGFGLPVVEAATAGTRGLLVSDIEVFHWVCGDQARYVDPHSEADIANGLRREIEHPQDMEMDVDRFTWDATAATIRDVCERSTARA